MTGELWNRVRAIPGGWDLTMNVIRHASLEDQLGNHASILVALVEHETGHLCCNCCARGYVLEAEEEILTVDEMDALGDLGWVSPPTMKEWGEDPRAAREKYEGQPPLPTERQRALLNLKESQ